MATRVADIFVSRFATVCAYFFPPNLATQLTENWAFDQKCSVDETLYDLTVLHTKVLI